MTTSTLLNYKNYVPSRAKVSHSEEALIRELRFIASVYMTTSTLLNYKNSVRSRAKVQSQRGSCVTLTSFHCERAYGHVNIAQLQKLCSIASESSIITSKLCYENFVSLPACIWPRQHCSITK